MSVDPEKEKRRQTGLFRRAGRKGVEDGIANFIAMTIQYGPIALILFLIFLAGGFVLSGGNILGIFQLSRPESQQTITIAGNQPTATIQSLVVVQPTETVRPNPTATAGIIPATNEPATQVPFVTEAACSDIPYAKWIWNLYEQPILADTDMGTGETNTGYGTGHIIAYMDDGTVEIGTYSLVYGYSYEQTFNPGLLTTGWWSNIHPFSTYDGAFALCIDQYGLFAALVPYNSFT